MKTCVDFSKYESTEKIKAFIMFREIVSLELNMIRKKTSESLKSEKINEYENSFLSYSLNSIKPSFWQLGTTIWQIYYSELPNEHPDRKEIFKEVRKETVQYPKETLKKILIDGVPYLNEILSGIMRDEFPAEVLKLREVLKNTPRTEVSSRNEILDEIIRIEFLHIKVNLEMILNSDAEFVKCLLEKISKEEVLCRVLCRRELLRKIIMAEVFSDRTQAIMMRTYGDH